jgi:hypothetical protein
MKNSMMVSNKSIKKIYAFDSKYIDSKVSYSDDFDPKPLEKDSLSITNLFSLFVSLVNKK